MKYERNSNQIPLHFISQTSACPKSQGSWSLSFPSHSHPIQTSFRWISAEFREILPEFELEGRFRKSPHSRSGPKLKKSQFSNVLSVPVQISRESSISKSPSKNVRFQIWSSVCLVLYWIEWIQLQIGSRIEISRSSVDFQRICKTRKRIRGVSRRSCYWKGFLDWIFRVSCPWKEKPKIWMMETKKLIF